jgi:hypothetical protein
MRRHKLHLDALAVESMDAGAAPEGLGTVHAASGLNTCMTCPNHYTDDGYNTCHYQTCGYGTDAVPMNTCNATCSPMTVTSPTTKGPAEPT